MKLCILATKIDREPLFESIDYALPISNVCYLYILPEVEYKKCILKGIMSTREGANAAVVYSYIVKMGRIRYELGEELISKCALFSHRYATNILNERFLLGEKTIKQSSYREDYEEYFNIKL